MAVTLYRQVGKGKARRYQKVNLGRRPTNLARPHFLRYSLADGTRTWEPSLPGRSTRLVSFVFPSSLRQIQTE